jgi:HEAT repeat protein
MARKNSKKTSIKKHSPIPVKTESPAAPPKKAAAPIQQTPANPAVNSGVQAKGSQAESKTAGAPAIIAAAEKIEHSVDRAAVAANIAALRDTNADVARDAATALGRLGDASAVEPLIDALTNADGYFHCVVRAAAASSLAQLRDARAFYPLAGAVRDTMAEASAEAVRALAAMRDPRAVGVLIDIVRNPTGFFLSTVRLAAVSGLKQLGGEAAAAELLNVAGNASEDPVIREAAR